MTPYITHVKLSIMLTNHIISSIAVYSNYKISDLLFAKLVTPTEVL